MTRSWIAEDAEAVEWDAVVVGTGMGGATAGYELARLGRRVLFIEKGYFLHDKPSIDGNKLTGPDGASSSTTSGASHDDPDARMRSGRWPLRIRGSTSFGDVEFFAPLGCGSGGSTTLYAAALERFAPADFSPRANFPSVTESTLPERWPISYEELRPYYEQAEDLFRVRGTPDPLDTAGAGVTLQPPPEMSPRDQHLYDSFSTLGLNPYRVHVGCEFVEGCTGCAPGLCPRGCKNDAARICLLPALEKHGARLLPESEVVRLEAGPGAVRFVHCRRAGKTLKIRARIVVLAAGAYMTPVLLLNSRSEDWPDGLANRSGLVGRNLMFHASDFVLVAPLKRLSDQGPLKSLALNDFYRREGEKLGTFQTSGASVELGQIMQFIRDDAERDPVWWKQIARPRPMWWRKVSSPLIRLAALLVYYGFNMRSAGVWVTIVEDLPYYENRILVDPSSIGGMRFEYRYPDELKQRVRSFRSRLAKALSPHRMILLSGEANINYGHPCGTCRFGDDSRDSVLDKYNRAHGIDNLYVVDASFFPSSGGTNPSLTIAANALRVATDLHKRME